MFFRIPEEMRKYETHAKYDTDMISAEENDRAERRVESLQETTKNMPAASLSVL